MCAAAVEHNRVAHRLGDEWIMEYAAGTLSEGEAILVASHLSFLPDAAEMLEVAEAIGGSLLEHETSASMAPDALASVLARIDGAATAAPLRGRPSAATESILPTPLREWLGVEDVEDLKWSFMGPGMKKIMLWRGPGDQRVWMLRAQPGTKIPVHGHRGTELTLVLKGAFDDPHGHFGVGDIEEKDELDMHALTIADGEECICLALTEGPIKLKGLIARMMQPFIGL